MKLFKGSVHGWAVCLAVLAVAPVLADDGTIRKGVDVWSTVEGQAQTSFAQEPIPAGFFCRGSKPFAGTVVFKGVPLATKPAGGLPRIDTVVSRLDDAVFNAEGEARTRIRLTALSLASVEPIATECGAYDVTVTLAGEQPTTTMRIVRTEAKGGRYEAPLALNVKVAFTPVTGKGRQLELVRRIDLGPGTASVWTYANVQRGKRGYDGPIWIDTNGDGRPDKQVRQGSSNFLAGVSPTPTPQLASWNTSSTVPTCPPGLCPYQSCHCNPNEDAWDPFEDGDGCAEDHLHCVWVCVDPSTIPNGAFVTCAMTMEGPGI